MHSVNNARWVLQGCDLNTEIWLANLAVVLSMQVWFARLGKIFTIWITIVVSMYLKLGITVVPEYLQLQQSFKVKSKLFYRGKRWPSYYILDNKSKRLDINVCTHTSFPNSVKHFPRMFPVVNKLLKQKNQQFSWTPLVKHKYTHRNYQRQRIHIASF